MENLNEFAHDCHGGKQRVKVGRRPESGAFPGSIHMGSVRKTRKPNPLNHIETELI
ncbi:hypothetical protein Pla144_45480 [Bythopirellula polymerisocia]|uniref:Uncharacterized protein n=1 Tax=Bythopirellula polymerisocia TaxID=2528003 RepID=A0A5C6CCL9_9BACT|nr:hypothetical protein Pla144_45480 [Bythopirellula polymerisocia]